MLLFLLFGFLWGGLLLHIKGAKVSRPFVWFTMTVIWLYWGFAYTNAPDTDGYMDFFYMLSTSGWVLDSLIGSSAGGMEPATFVLMQFCKRISGSYYFFQAIILLIDLGLSFWGLKRLLGNKEQPITFFLLFTYSITMYLSALRQGVAIAIMIFCLSLFRDKKYWLYIPLLVLAIFFHQSAILLFAIPVVILIIKKVKLGDDAGLIFLFVLFVICNICHMFGINAGKMIESIFDGFVYDSSLSTSREMSVTGAMEESNFGVLKVIEMDVIYLVFFFSKKSWKTEAHNYMGAFFLAYFVLNMLVGGIIIHRLTYYLRIPYYFILFESLRYVLIKEFKWNFSMSNMLIYVYMFALIVIQDLGSGKHIFEYHLLDLF